MTLRILSFALLACITALSFVSVERAVAEELYKSNTGDHKIVEVATFDLKDAKRDKTLPLRLTFPREAGKYPLIVFSHGAMGSKDAYGPLVKHWASHGYVCIQPTHEDSLQLLRRSGERFRLRNVWAKWDTRPPDVKLILDSLDELEADVEGLKGKN